MHHLPFRRLLASLMILVSAWALSNVIIATDAGTVSAESNTPVISAER
jgi:hypothetical protein